MTDRTSEDVAVVRECLSDATSYARPSKRQARAALDRLQARLKAAEAAGCGFGCGPYPHPEQMVGDAGVGIVPACPTHGWIVPLLDARDSALAAAKADAEEAKALIRKWAADPNGGYGALAELNAYLAAHEEGK